MSNARFAYVFYATNDVYALGALVAIKQLKHLQVQDEIEFVILHLSLSDHILVKIEEMEVIAKPVSPLNFYSPDNHYKDCLIKLRVFHLIQYDRIVFLDADSLPLKNLDHLFTLPFKESIAAPRAYWLPQPFITSLLLVVNPSLILWNQVQKYFETAEENNLYDMDIVNYAFKDEIHFLPDTYACLNTEWEDQNRPFYFDSPEHNYDEEIKVVHFSALGKPWSHHPTDVPNLRPQAHPIFYKLWLDWWKIYASLFDQDFIIKE